MSSSYHPLTPDYLERRRHDAILQWEEEQTQWEEVGEEEDDGRDVVNVSIGPALLANQGQVCYGHRQADHGHQDLGDIQKGEGDFPTSSWNCIEKESS